MVPTHKVRRVFAGELCLVQMEIHVRIDILQSIIR